MGPNDPFGERAPDPIQYPQTPERARLDLGAIEEVPRSYFMAAIIGMAIGLSTWVIGWLGTIVVLGYGLAAVIVLALVQWSRRHLDIAGAYRALTRRS